MLLYYLLPCVLATCFYEVEGSGINFSSCNTTCLLTWTVQSYTRPDVCDCGANMEKENYLTGSCTGSQVADGTTVKINVENCMTFEEEKNVTYVGKCPYNNHAFHENSYTIIMPRDARVLNNFMCNYSYTSKHPYFCGQQRRRGFLCSICEEGLGPAVMSYTHQCVQCEWYGWLLYLTLSLVPATVLCFTIIVFRVNVLSPPLNAIVLYCQVITSYVNSKPCTFLYYAEVHQIANLSVWVLTLYGFFNMDFFVYVIPPFCISNSMSTHTAIALDYTVALFPLVFLALIYFLITCHDSGCTILVCLWRPIHKCLFHFRKSWDVKGSILNAFATLYVMSFTKIISTSASLMLTTDIENVCGTFAHRTKLYYNASCTLFGKCHIPYGVTLTIISVIFIFLPSFFVICYPCKLCNKCTTSLTSKSKLALLFQEIAKIFQQSFKDGIGGSLDCRWFAGIHLLIRVVIATSVDWKSTDQIQMITAIFSLILVALIQPHRHTFHNCVDGLLYGWLAVTFVLLPAKQSYRIALVLLFFLPLAFLMVLIGWKLYQKWWTKVKLCAIVSLKKITSKAQRLVIERNNHIDSYEHVQEPLLKETEKSITYTIVDLTD